MEPRELEMDELSILEYLSSDSCRPKSMLEVNSSPFNISEERIAVINAIVLTPKAIANIEGNDNSEPHAVNLEAVLNLFCQTVKHNTSKGNLSKSDEGRTMKFMINSKTSVEIKPCKGAFDNPPFGDDVELFRTLVRPKDYLKTNTKGIHEVLGQLCATVPAVCKEFAKSATDDHTFSNDIFHHVAVIGIRRRHNHGQRKAKNVNGHAQFPSFDFLVPVNASLFVDMAGGSHALGIHYPQTGLFFPSGNFPYAFPQVSHNQFKMPLVFPLPEIGVHRLPWGKVAWQHTPLAACYRYIEQGVHNILEIVLSFAFFGLDFVRYKRPLKFS